MSPIIKIAKQKISEQVLEQMQNNILSGEWLPGTKIPGEMELVSSFEVSRISVRQAIHQLVGMGILTIKRGDGTYVSEAIPVQYFNILLPYLMIERPNIIDVFEYRCILEAKTAALAAERATSEDIKMLEETFRKLSECKDDHDEYIKYDLLFHTMIAAASKNSVIVKITSILFNIVRHTMREAIAFVGVEKGTYYHFKLLEAIRAKNSVMAEKFMTKHVASSLEVVKKAIKKRL